MTTDSVFPFVPFYGHCEKYPFAPCNLYAVIEVVYKGDFDNLHKDSAKDIQWSGVTHWRMTKDKYPPKRRSCNYSGNGGGYVGGYDRTAETSAQEVGLEDSDFEFY